MLDCLSSFHILRNLRSWIPTSSPPLGSPLERESRLEQESRWCLGDSSVRLVKSWLFPCPYQSWIWCQHQKTHFVKTPRTLCLAHCIATWWGSTPRRWKNNGESKYQHAEPLYLSNNHLSFAKQSCLARELLNRFSKVRIELKVIEGWNIYAIKII